MRTDLLKCGDCRRDLSVSALNAGLVTCPFCDGAQQIIAFPALVAGSEATREAERLMVEGESSCFYHERKKAARPCEGCGRFMCALCDLEVFGRHICPACLEKERTDHKSHTFADRRVRYDSVALALALWPVFLCWPITIVTAPMAGYVAVRYWSAPRPLVRSSRWRAVVAVGLAGLEGVGWLALVGLMIQAILS